MSLKTNLVSICSKEIGAALDEVDIILLVAECRKPGRQEMNLLSRFRGRTVILVLNKIDKVPKKMLPKLLWRIRIF